MVLKKHFLLITLTPLLLLAIGASFYRFLILDDYEVVYEMECDPYTEQCYMWCEDDACEDIFYYKYVSRYAPDILELCGPDVTDCEAAYFCTEAEGDSCSVDYCTDGSAECETLTESDLEEEDDPDATEFYQEFLELQNL